MKVLMGPLELQLTIYVIDPFNQPGRLRTPMPGSITP